MQESLLEQRWILVCTWDLAYDIVIDCLHPAP